MMKNTSFPKLVYTLISLCGILNECFCHIDVQHKVICLEDRMKIYVSLTKNDTEIYLDGLNGYKNEKCDPKYEDNNAIFNLDLDNFYECGIMRVINQRTGKGTFYHKVVVKRKSLKQIQKIDVKCTFNSNLTKSNQIHSINKRDTLPIGFTEPEDLEISTDIVGKAPEPILSVGVKQNNSLISENLNVSPGTPLVIEISLDQVSADVYGLSVSQMQVTDTRTQEEIIIYNGCSVDPYLFENFQTSNGDLLTAKFRAFKFPDSSYVQFKVVVNVCLNSCDGTECSNGQIGYGRRKRDIDGKNTKKMYEIYMSTFIKVDYEKDSDKKSDNDIEESIKKLKLANQKLNRASRGNIPGQMSDHFKNDNAKVEETGYSTKHIISSETNFSRSLTNCNFLIIFNLIIIMLQVGKYYYH